VRRAAEGGFTLLEVIVAMALFAAGIIVVLQLFSGALRLSAGSRDASASAIYARQRMEEALLVPNPVEGVEQGTFGDNFRWEVVTSLVPQGEDLTYDEIQVHVTVRWDDGGDERAVDLSSTRWVLKEKDDGGLPPRWPEMPPTSLAGSIGIPGMESGETPGTGGGGDPGDYLGAYVRRRLR